MRPDMAKVIVERPRLKGYAWNKPKGYQRKLRKLAADGPPLREGMKRRWKQNSKLLNENLAPLRRYLESQIGRPWNIVFSEICAHINRSSAVQDHVRDHVEDYVTTHVLVIDGVPCFGGGAFGLIGRPLREMPWKPWYVCPRTGILKKNKFNKRKKSGDVTENSPRCFRVSRTEQCRLIDGAWHLVIVKPLPLLLHMCKDRDVVLDQAVGMMTEAMARQEYGAAVYAVAKRRLARRELRGFPIPAELWV
jgi:hypothetical protein